jgi:Tfp pilus assembly protein FimT
MVPGMGSWITNYRLRSATRDIVSNMRAAQMKAVSTNLEYRVYFNTAERKYWIERGNQSDLSTNWVGTTAVDNAAREGALNTLPSGVTINFNSFIEFNTDSRCNAATIIVTNSKGKQSTISVAPSTGRVKSF